MTLLKNNESHSQKHFFFWKPCYYTKKSNEKSEPKILFFSRGQGLPPTTKRNESQIQKHFSSQGQKVNHKKRSVYQKTFCKIKPFNLAKHKLRSKTSIHIWMHSNLQELLLYILKCYKRASQNVTKGHHKRILCDICLRGIVREFIMELVTEQWFATVA